VLAHAPRQPLPWLIFNVRQKLPSMKKSLDVSRGRRLTFAANGKPISGTIVGSRREPGTCAAVAVRPDAHVPQGAKLTMSDIPETGGCGVAEAVDSAGTIELLIGYSYVEDATIGK
jgi:hypothetical protein